jgi:hypothetical protein
MTLASQKIPYSSDASFRRLADRVGVGIRLTEAFWEMFKPHLTERRDGRGRPAFDKRSTFEAILWVATTRRNWRDVPARYGQWNSIYRQFSRWSEAGIWEFMRSEVEDGTDVARVLDELMDLWGRIKFRHRDGLIPRVDCVRAPVTQ